MRQKVRNLPHETDRVRDGVIAILNGCKASGAVGLLYGGGLRRSWALGQYNRLYRGAWIVTAHPGVTSVSAVLKQLAQAVQLEEVTKATRRAIERRLKGTEGVIVVDRSDLLDVDALDAFRSIHDATGIGLVYAGEKAFADRIEANARNPLYEPLRSRVAFARHLDEILDPPARERLRAAREEERHEG